MSGRFLLDTNIVIALWANDEAVTHQLTTASETFIPIIVLDELYYGARKSVWSAKNIALLTSSQHGIVLCFVT
jgi:tRNA(fMet)-specific endonuclease VapC